MQKKCTSCARIFGGGSWDNGGMGKKRGIEVPDALYDRVSKRARSLRGGRSGMTKYVWTLAALIVLELGDEELRAAASTLREHMDRADPNRDAATQAGWPSVVDLLAVRRGIEVSGAAKKVREAALRALRKSESKR